MAHTPSENQPQGAPAAKPVPARPAVPAGRPAAVAQAAPAEADDESEEEQGGASGYGSKFVMLTAVPSWLVSMVVHIVGLFLAAFVTFTVPTNDDPQCGDHERGGGDGGNRGI